MPQSPLVGSFGKDLHMSSHSPRVGTVMQGYRSENAAWTRDEYVLGVLLVKFS